MSVDQSPAPNQGRRLFERLLPDEIALERTRILEVEAGVTHMHYRIRR